MKNNLGCILLVEGQHDKAKILSKFNGEIIVTNGYQIDEQLLLYLSKAKDYKKVVIFVDPDEAGKEIRKHLENKLPFAESIEVNIDKCNHKGKHGVAECSIEEIEDKVKKFVIVNYKYTINKSDLYSMNLIGKSNSKELRERVSDHFGILNYSSECFLTCLNTLNIDKEDIWKFLEKIY